MADKPKVSDTNYAKLPPGEYPCGVGLTLVVRIGRAGALKGRWKQVFYLGGLKMVAGLGATSDVSYGEAMTMALKNRTMSRDGIDPRAVRDEARKAVARENAPLFLAYATEWRETYSAANHRHRASRQKLERIVGEVCAPLHKIRVDQITTEHIVKLVLAPIWKTEVETARDTRQALARIFNAAIADKWCESNPADWLSRLKPKLGKGGKRGKIRGRHKPLAPSFVPAFWQALEASGNQSAKALQVTLLTVARTAEIQNMRWAQLDLDGAGTLRPEYGPEHGPLWIIAATDVPKDTDGGEGTKNDCDKIQPLVPAAVAVLRALPRDGEYVFPGRGGKGPMSNMTMLNAIKAMTGDPKATVHGLRGTFRTWAQDDTDFEKMGETVEHCMHHIKGDAAEKAYKHGKAIKKRRVVLHAWAAYATRRPAKVIPLPRIV